MAFWNIIVASPEQFVRCFFSFFGHFGVQMFIFISAYGLTKKFMASRQHYLTFIKSRFFKIYPMFLLAIGFWLLKIMLETDFMTAVWTFLHIGMAGKLLFISNFIPGQALNPIGPWWFIPFIMQFYFVFPFLYSFAIKYASRGLLICAVVGLILVFSVNDYLQANYRINLYFSFLGHLPEICLAIYFAQKKECRQPNFLVFAVAAMVFILGCLNRYAWYFNHISALVILIHLYHWLKRGYFIVSPINSLLLFYGKISMPLFLVNGFLREPMLTYAKNDSRWYIVISYAIISMLISTLIAIVLLYCNEKLMKLLRKWAIVPSRPPIQK
jgi:peptidoglycan/LPS O-acetylase OafA/YrhL